MSARQNTVSPFADAQRAMAQRDWATAVAVLRTHDENDPLPVVGLELLAQATYANGEMEAAVTTWERIHAAHLQTDDRLAAAQSALMVGMFLLMDSGMMAPVRAWLARAERLLEGYEDTSVHAWDGMVRCCEALMSGDVEGMKRWSRVAVEMGMRHDVMPAVAIGRTEHARSLIFNGEVVEGLALLDQVAVLLLSGEVDPLTSGMVYCELICAAQGLAQYDRAQEWTEAMERWRHGTAFGGINGRCRVHRAEILRLRGPYDLAETEALHACEELRPWLRREFGWPLTELGTIRLRRGDLAGAEEAFLAAHERAWEPQPGLALLRLAQGDVQAAMSLIIRALEHPVLIPSKERPPQGGLCRAPLLDAQVQIAAAAGDVETAAEAAAELGEIAGAFGSLALDAAAALASGRVALMRGHGERAVAACELAVARWSDVNAPYETAVARTVLARALQVTGEEATAQLERGSAIATFTRLGAKGALQEEPFRTVQAPLSAPQGQACVFRCDGDTRTITYDSKTVLLKDLKGLRYLARLLAEPGREFHAVDLVAVDNGVMPRGSHAESPSGGVGDAGVLLDEQARRSYRRRLDEVEQDITEAQGNNDIERAARAEADRDYLVQELARAVGMGGRMRRAGAPSERARTSVTHVLQYALSRIAEHHTSLADHLGQTVRTGTYCVYRPDPRVQTSWQV
ncbi:hypothetical protein BH24ACT15_BH24ACT15_09720 [soil metagenome]